MKFILILGAISLAGCGALESMRRAQEMNSNPNNYKNAEAQETEEQARERIHNGYIGKTENELILEAGAPEKVEQLGEIKVYSYITDHGESVKTRGGIFGSGRSSGSASAFGTHARGETYSSGLAVQNTTTTHNVHFQRTRFYIQSGKVVKWDYKAQ